MIAMAAMVSTSEPPRPVVASGRRRLLALGAAGLLGGCVVQMAPDGPPVTEPEVGGNAFTMPDGARLPYRAWLPEGPPRVVVLALHGFEDSRDAWEYPAPVLAAAGVAVYAPDQRGFGATLGRGLWPGTAALVADAAEMARLVRALHPGAKLVLMGESMGGAVLMVLATGKLAPPDTSYVLLAPAVWGRSRMNIAYSGLLWLAVNVAPAMVFTHAPVKIVASDNRVALLRLSTDPLTIHHTRVDVLNGIVDLMDAAMTAAPRMRATSLFLYGGKDEVVPKAATAFVWRALPRGGTVGPRLAYYPAGYHLLLRDLDRAVPTADILAWLDDPTIPLPSGADRTADLWLDSRT